MKKTIALLLLCCLCKAAAFAVPVYPRPVKITQPTGSQLTIVGHGDEYLHFTTTTDGYNIVKDTDGFYHYAQLEGGKLVATGVKAHEAGSRASDETLFLSSAAKNQVPEMTERAQRMRAILNHESEAESLAKSPMRKVAGTKKPYRGLVLLVQFNDRSFVHSAAKTKAHFDDLMNKENYSGYYDIYYGQQFCTGSVRDYFSDNSYGTFVPEFDVVGPITIDVSQYYINAYENTEKLTKQILAAVDDTVDFSQYDSDGDGEVDMVYIIYAGYASHYEGNDSRLVWPHASSLYDSQDPTSKVMHDGVRMGRYACSSEIYGWSQYEDLMLDGIGVIVHEFSHVLGFQDHYDVLGYQEHPNTWDVMASGNYNGDINRTPCAYNSYEKVSAGFVGIRDISKLDGDTITLTNYEQSEDACFIQSMQKHVCFYMENRQPIKWDKGLVGHGLLVWRVDSVNPEYWKQNYVNVTTRACFRLVRACGTQGNVMSGVEDVDFDPFPGTFHVRTLNNEPGRSNLLSYDKYASPVVLDSINENDGVITFIVNNDPLSDNQPISYDIAAKFTGYADRLVDDQWVPVKWTVTSTSIQQSDGTWIETMYNLLPNYLGFELEGADYSKGIPVSYTYGIDGREINVNATRVARSSEQSVWMCDFDNLDQSGSGVMCFNVSRHGIPTLKENNLIGYASLKPSAYIASKKNLLGHLDTYRNVQYVTYGAPRPEGLKGDINGDGTVDVSDVNILINIILGNESASKYSNADVTGDGDIDVSDVNFLINKILG